MPSTEGMIEWLTLTNGGGGMNCIIKDNGNCYMDMDCDNCYKKINAHDIGKIRCEDAPCCGCCDD